MNEDRRKRLKQADKETESSAQGSTSCPVIDIIKPKIWHRSHKKPKLKRKICTRVSKSNPGLSAVSPSLCVLQPQHVFSPVMQSNARMMAPPAHGQPSLVSSSTTQYPEQTHTMYGTSRPRRMSCAVTVGVSPFQPLSLLLVPQCLQGQCLSSIPIPAPPCTLTHSTPSPLQHLQAKPSRVVPHSMGVLLATQRPAQCSIRSTSRQQQVRAFRFGKQEFPA